ncbi:MAG: acetate--CoA ligase family protein [Chloroflexi bacterium]|nr:acetate--CoA ligase family protein [Chloroflexota bacterium]MYD49421.1 acetate--CoA ligase family protein [Chloroflexota bacterium]
MTFWSDEQLASIDRMLNPRSIAVVGATPRMQYGGRFLAAAMGSMERGVDVYPVNPRYEEVQGLKAYPSVSELPEAPDVVGVVVPYHAVLDTLRESHEKGAKSAIVISAGFAERGVDDRRDLQGELGRFAQESGMRVSGPNCLGLANLKDDIWASASSRGASGLSGPVGLVCQSGASAFGPFLTRAVDEGIGFTYIVSTGNEADLDFCDFARYLLDDDDTKVIAGFIEGFKNGRKFVEVARLAAERGKPIVLIKIGRSELGSRAAGSHTAALTGVDARYEAVFEQYGVTRVQDYDDLLQVSNLLARCPRPPSRGVAVVSHSGGISSLTADMFGQAGLDLPPLSERAQDGINGILKGFGWAANPSDVTGFANSDDFPAIMSYMAEDENVGTLVVASAGADAQATQVIAQRDGSDKPVAFLWTGTRGAQSGLPMLRQAGIPVFYVPDKLAAGVRYLNDYHDWRERWLSRGVVDKPEPTAGQEALAKALNGEGALSEYDSKALLRAFGVPTTRGQRVEDTDGAVAAAERIGYPVVVKVNSADILHKTEAGAIRLGLADADAVRKAFEEVTAGARAYDANARIDGALVQEMVSGGVETIVGISYDEQLGPFLLFGTGGVMVEVYEDVALRLCPITRQDALEMIDQVKGARLLRGFRGALAADVDALADTLVRVSQMAALLEGSLGELDINPLMVLPAGQGVKAADALVVGVGG